MALYSTEWPIAGHDWAVRRLAATLNAGRLRHAYLITGPAGIGKTTLARVFAQAACCLSERERPCGTCRACTLIAQNVYADFSLIQADTDKLKIEQVREMQRTLALRPVEGRYRVIILRRFNEASQQAMDALLKTLEEPPPYVLLILTADTAEKLLTTIQSRCQPVHLRLMPAAVIRQTLETHLKIAPDRAALLAQLAGGRMGWALRAIDDEAQLDQRGEWLDMLEKTLGQMRIARFTLAESLSKDKHAAVEMLDLWQSYWRDALLLACHTQDTAITNRDRRHALEQVAANLRADDVYSALKAVRRTIRYIESNVNTRLALETLMLDLPRLRLFAAPPG